MLKVLRWKTVDNANYILLRTTRKHRHQMNGSSSCPRRKPYKKGMHRGQATQSKAKYLGRYRLNATYQVQHCCTIAVQVIVCTLTSTDTSASWTTLTLGSSSPMRLPAQSPRSGCGHTLPTLLKVAADDHNTSENTKARASDGRKPFAYSSSTLGAPVAGSSKIRRALGGLLLATRQQVSAVCPECPKGMPFGIISRPRTYNRFETYEE